MKITRETTVPEAYALGTLAQKQAMERVKEAFMDHQLAVTKAQTAEAELHSRIHDAMAVEVPAQILSKQLSYGLSTIYMIRQNVRSIRQALELG